MLRKINFCLCCHRIFLLVSLILILSGCVGPSQRIQSTKDLSSSGILYAEAVDGLLNVTIDRIIDFDSTEALQVRKRAKEETLEQSIKERDAALIELLNELNSFKKYTQQLKAYFQNLQALANSSVQKDTGAAVLELSKSINNANEVIRKDKAIELDKETMDDISTLGELVAKQVHAAKISTALRRDAGIISEQLILHEKLIENLAEMLEDCFDVESDKFYSDKVFGPYVNKQQKIGVQWKKDRKIWLTSQFTLGSLNKAKEAAKQLRAIWEEILQGRSDLGSITMLLQDINEFVEVVNEINNANESNGGTQ